MWLINLFSLFSCFGALVVLAFLLAKSGRKDFLRLLLIISIYVFSYAAGMLYLIINFGFSVPELQNIEVIPPEPSVFYYLGSLLYLTQSGLILLAAGSLKKNQNIIVYVIAGIAATAGFIIPDLMLLFYREPLFVFADFFIIIRLLFLYSIMEYGVISVFICRKKLPGSLKPLLGIMSVIFAAIVIPAMLLEDLLSLYYGMVIYNIMEAAGFLLLMTTVLVAGIIYSASSGFRRNNTDSSGLTAFSELPLKYGLTQREMDVLKELLNGCSYKEIAYSLSISAETVKTHVSRIYKKTGTSAKQELKYKIDLSEA